MKKPPILMLRYPIVLLIVALIGAMVVHAAIVFGGDREGWLIFFAVLMLVSMVWGGLLTLRGVWRFLITPLAAGSNAVKSSEEKQETQQ